MMNGRVLVLLFPFQVGKQEEAEHVTTHTVKLIQLINRFLTRIYIFFSFFVL